MTIERLREVAELCLLDMQKDSVKRSRKFFRKLNRPMPSDEDLLEGVASLLEKQTATFDTAIVVLDKALRGEPLDAFEKVSVLLADRYSLNELLLMHLETDNPTKEIAFELAQAIRSISDRIDSLNAAKS